MKTVKNEGDVYAFIDKAEKEQTRADCRELIALMQEVTGEPPALWGPSIVGFGSYHYKYASGREGDFLLVGFSPRKQNLTLYIMGGFKRHDALMQSLGKYKTGKSCLYVKQLDDIDRTVLRSLIEESVAYMRSIDIKTS
ncbi:MAG: DUF1801 domain-containing protein [Cryomorphaceae bacterium]